MKRILVFGAGMVAKPLVDHLLQQQDFEVEVADVMLERAQRLVGRNPRGTARGLKLEDVAAVSDAVMRSDLVVSLAPASYHLRIGRVCLERGKHLLTASYVSEPMKALDAEARAKGLLFLNELGLDPGLDHMEAMRIIHEVRSRGGRVREFISYCGGVPAPDSNTNPLGYKFSWSPVGVLRAGNNSALFLKDGREVLIPAERLFAEPSRIDVEGLGVFEGYPNRDSLQYIELYGIPEAKTMVRGTLRWPGWCRTMKAVRDLGLLDDSPADWTGRSYADVLRMTLGLASGQEIKEAVTRRLGPQEGSADILAKLEWLGLWSEDVIPPGCSSALEALAHLMAERLRYAPGERDLIVLRHNFACEYPSGERESIESTLVDYGLPQGDSAMARTVGLPLAVCAELVLQGKITATGVRIPVLPEIYAPTLAELKNFGIAFREKRSRA